jgi:polysaccharide deacetylase family protein (PEP-CTERM system associated)
MINAISVDVEDWIQSSHDLTHSLTERVYRNTDEVLDLFSRKRIKGTFFIQGLVAEKKKEIVEIINSAGHEVQTHGFSHQLITSQTPQEFREDLYKSKCILEDIIGKKIIGYRAPDFSIVKESLWALEILGEEEIIYDSSIYPIYNLRYGIPHWSREVKILNLNNGKKIIEIPVCTVRNLSYNLPMGGGGYFRLYPYWLIKRSIRKVNTESYRALIYLHPYEFDSAEFYEREEKIYFFRKFHQGWGRNNFFLKISNLLNDFNFSSIGEVFKNEIERIAKQRGEN